MMPKFIIDVISNHKDSVSALALAGRRQYAQDATSIPMTFADLAAQTASAEVTPRLGGQPAPKVCKVK